MGGFSLTGLAAGAAAGESVRFEQVWRNGAASIASAATVDLGVSAGVITITGSTGPITSFGSAAETGALKILIFASTPTITHHATSMIIPGAANLTMAAGDSLLVSHLGSGNWRVVNYMPASLFVPFSAGTAAAPSVTFAGDLNTGIYSAGADSLGLSAGGSVRANVTTSGMSVTGALSVSGALTAGSFSPSSISTGSLTAVAPAGGTLSLTTQSYLSGENVAPAGITISAGSANNFSKVGGDITISSGWGTFGPGNISVSSSSPSSINVDSGSISLSTGSADRDSGSISLATGTSTGGATGDRTGAISLATGDGFDVGNITLNTGTPSGTNNYGMISLGNQGVSVVSISRELLSLGGSNPPAITSGAGSGATISGGKSKFVLTCGTSAGSTITLTDDVCASKAFYYWSGGVAAPRPVYGGVADGSGVFTLVFPGAPSSGHRIYVYCLG